LVLPLWLQFAVKVTIWGQTLAKRAMRFRPKADIAQRLNDLVDRRSCRGTATRSSQASARVRRR
jgi:hypothetical protein